MPVAGVAFSPTDGPCDEHVLGTHLKTASTCTDEDEDTYTCTNVGMCIENGTTARLMLYALIDALKMRVSDTAFSYNTENSGGLSSTILNNTPEEQSRLEYYMMYSGWLTSSFIDFHYQTTKCL